MPKKIKKKKRHVVRNIFLILILLIVLAIGGGVFYYFHNLSPVGDGTNKVTFEIEEGDTYDTVLTNLEKDKLIHSKDIAQLYSKVSQHNSYYAGYFNLNDGMSTEEILDYISDINNASTQQVTVTVPEGTWAKNIAASLAEQFPDYSKDDFLNKWNDMDYIKKLAKDYEFIDPEALDNDEYNVKLEGYLFPNTYSFDKNATIDEITRTFLDQLNTVYQTYKSDVEKSQYSFHELLTLASIVQFESGSAQDMATIAGVFYNRLDEGMDLQSSVTVCYALYDEYDSATACEVNTDVDSPYNTYVNSGLPIGPISNPGEEALKAVLEPEDNNYLFFVADVNGDGTVYYSETYEEHEQKMEELNLFLD